MLVNCLSIRRPKTTIELLPRRDDIIYLDFSPEEWEDYQRAKSKTLYNLDNVDGGDGATKFLNALKWVNALRLMCNHGTGNPKETQKIEETLPTWSIQEAQARFDQLDGVGLAKCSNAACAQDLSSALSSETGAEHEDEPYIGESLELWCSLCFKGQGDRATKVFKICNHLPRRSQEQHTRDKNDKTFLETDSSGPPRLIARKKDDRLPTKVKTLLRDLLQTPDDTKRFVVAFFSDLSMARQWLNSQTQRHLLFLDQNIRHRSAPALGAFHPLCPPRRHPFRQPPRQRSPRVPHRTWYPRPPCHHLVRRYRA